MKNNLVIRQTTDANDFAACAAMMAVSDPWITLGMDTVQCSAAFEGACKEVYVVEIDHALAGFVILQVCGSFKGYIQTICVAPEYRGKSIGSALLQFCEERIGKISPNIFICVSSFNSGAIKLYEQFGFVLVGELKDFVQQGFTELLMRKTKGPLIGYIGKE